MELPRHMTDPGVDQPHLSLQNHSKMATIPPSFGQPHLSLQSHSKMATILPFLGQPHLSLQNHSKIANILPSLGQPRPGRFSASLLCLSCQGQPVWSNVETRISRSGWIWAAACFLCGSPWFSLLVKCLDCFREWIHRCPRCGKELAVFSPSPTFAVLTGLIIVSLLTLLLGLLFLFLLFDWWFD